MNTRFVSNALLGLSLVALPFLGGCTQEATATSESIPAATNAEPAVAEFSPEPAAVIEAAPEVVAQVVTSSNAPATIEAAATTPEAAPILPPDLSVSAPLAQVIKLTQSGVDQKLLLSFITNTTGVFSIGAEEIIYLNDLGVAGEVITTMMQHDQELRALRLSAVQAHTSAATVASTPAAPVQEEVASAPTYVTAPAMEAEPAYVSDDYFADTLAPYGSWTYVSGYGNCWRPTVCASNPGWRPYCNRGRWVYSNCGWYWLSDYSWGATTFHYGRWFDAPGVGWCWWPDTVWAPSWVSWRYTSDYCGWAPLPPTACYRSGFGLMYQSGSVGVGFGFGLSVGAYAFVPWNNFCAPRPYQHCLPPNRAAQVYATATPVNHYEAGGRGQVYNRGIAPERVREYSRSAVRTVNVQDKPGRALRPEQLGRDGSTLAVHRPILVPAGGEGGNSDQPAGKGAGRPEFRPANEAVITKPTQQPPLTSPSVAGQAEVRTGRERGNGSRSVNPAVSPLAPTIPPTADTKPATTSSGRIETRPGREHQVEAAIVNRAQPTSPGVIRPSDIAVTPVSTSPVTPKAPQPRIPQVMPQAAPRPAARAPSTSVVVVGGRNNTQSGGRDYSVWSSPSPTVNPSTPVRPSINNNAGRPTPSPSVNVQQIAENTPVPVTRPQPERSRGEFGRTQNRSSSSTDTAPSQGVQVTTIGARPAAAPAYTPRSVPAGPAPNYTQRPVPSAAPSAARVESRPAAVAPPASAPSQPASSPGRPNR